MYMAVLTVVQKHRMDKSSHVQEHNRSCSCFITQANLVEHVQPSTEEVGNMYVVH